MLRWPLWALNMPRNIFPRIKHVPAPEVMDLPHFQVTATDDEDRRAPGFTDDDKSVKV